MTAPSKQDMLDNVEIAINNIMAGGAVQSYSINGRNLQKISLADLIKLRNQLRYEIANGKVTGRTYAKFERPGGIVVRPDTTRFTRME